MKTDQKKSEAKIIRDIIRAQIRTLKDKYAYAVRSENWSWSVECEHRIDELEHLRDIITTKFKPGE